MVILSAGARCKYVTCIYARTANKINSYSAKISQFTCIVNEIHEQQKTTNLNLLHLNEKVDCKEKNNEFIKYDTVRVSTNS